MFSPCESFDTIIDKNKMDVKCLVINIGLMTTQFGCMYIKCD